MLVTPLFPYHRLQDPRRAAELLVHQELAGSGVPGQALYEMRAGAHAHQLDFGIWVEMAGRIGLQVKGGVYIYEDGRWWLYSVNGRELLTSCPISQTFDAAIAIRDFLKDQLRRSVFVFPVCYFPDMPRDPIIEAVAAEAHVTTWWAGTDLIGQMQELVQTREIRFPPTAAQIVQEVALIRPWMTPQADPGQEEAQAVIQVGDHQVHVHVHVHLPENLVAAG